MAPGRRARCTRARRASPSSSARRAPPPASLRPRASTARRSHRRLRRCSTPPTAHCRRDASRAGSLLPLLRAGADAAGAGEAGAGAVSEYHGPTAPTGACMLRRGRHKYVEYGGLFFGAGAFPPQLFDVEADEEERHDLAAVETETLATMRAAMRERLDCQAADRAAKRHDYELYEEHGRHGARMARACAPSRSTTTTSRIQRARRGRTRVGPAASSERIVENLFT